MPVAQWIVHSSIHVAGKGTLIFTIAARCLGIACRVDGLEATKVQSDGLAGRSQGILFAALRGSPIYVTVLDHGRLKMVISKSIPLPERE